VDKEIDLRILFDMADCIYCGTPTQLFCSNRPLCGDCSDRIDNGQSPLKNQGLDKDLPEISSEGFSK
jgi:hypothetical protein